MLRGVLAGLSLLMLTTIASAEDVDDGRRIGFTSSLVQRSIQTYYSMFGSWPKTWKDVKSAGLYTAQITAPNGSVVDPDDRHLGFPGDIGYAYLGDLPPKLFVWRLADGKDLFSDHSVTPPSKEIKIEFSQRQIQLTLLEKLWSSGVPHFVSINKRLPESWTDFVDSGVTPIDSNSVNPMTEAPYTGTGTPGDFLFEVRKDAAGKVEAIRLQWVNEEGYSVSLIHGWRGYFPDPDKPDSFMLKEVK